MRAYNYALLDEADNEDKEPEVFVGCFKAETVFREGFVTGMKHILKCSIDEAVEACCFPECIPYNKDFSYSSSLIKDLGFFLGYRSGHQSIAMRKYFEEHKNAD